MRWVDQVGLVVVGGGQGESLRIRIYKGSVMRIRPR